MAQMMADAPASSSANKTVTMSATTDKQNEDDLPAVNKFINSINNTTSMASTYFTLPSFARAKRNTEELRKSNPQVPILKDEDEKFLERTISTDDNAGSTLGTSVSASKITDNGKEVQASKAEQDKIASGDQVAIPATQPDAPAATPAKDAKKHKDLGLPSQEEAEAATKGWEAAFEKGSDSKADAAASGDKRTWASYLPSITTTGNKKGKTSTDSTTEAATAEKTEESSKAAASTTDTASPSQSRTWTEYASTYVPTQLPSLPKWKSKDKDAQLEPVYKSDGTIDEAETAAKQEKEVAVLLDNLNMSSINNRVFALSAETQKIYDNFALVLRDTMNGAPTAYDDMEKFMREAGPTLEKQFKAMPPFVQTLVKSLPAKIGTALAPEMLAAASDKPGADLKASNAAGSSTSGLATPKKGSKAATKSKRRIPGLKGLIGQQGAVAGILRNVVNFLRVRFPLLASTTNVVMSLSVFILMFVFWYCHKRGREARLEKESALGDGSVEEDDEFEGSEEDDEEEDDFERQLREKLNQPEPAQVPLPQEEDEKLDTEKPAGKA